MAEITAGKQRGRPWKPGRSGNPAGRPKGARHRALLALDAIGAEGAEHVMRSVVQAAQGGDMRAADILLRRLWPERKGRPVHVALPEIQSAVDLATGLAILTAAVAAGELSAEEGQSFAALMETHRKAIETADLEQRIAALEARQADAQQYSQECDRGPGSESAEQTLSAAITGKVLKAD